MIIKFIIMKKLNKALRNALYLVLPLCFFAVTYLMFAYIIWDFNPGNWSLVTRIENVVIGIVAMIFGGLIADNI